MAIMRSKHGAQHYTWQNMLLKALLLSSSSPAKYPASKLIVPVWLMGLRLH